MFCHGGSFDGSHEDNCRKTGHIRLVKKYADGHDAFMNYDSFFKLPSLDDAYKNGKS